MICINGNQLIQLSEAEWARFEARLAAHVEQTLMPQHDETSVKIEVRAALTHAIGHGLKTELEIALFVDLMIALGKDPLEDSNLRWIAEPLLERTDGSPSNIRIRRVLSLLGV